MAAICVWDFTLPGEVEDVENIRDWLKTHCKKWCFQKEIGETGYVHWQGRFSLKMKLRLGGLKKKMWDETHLSPTSVANHDNMFYVMKEDTRCEGPWSSEDKPPPFIPWDVELMTELYPWQQEIIDMVPLRTLRQIRVIVCPGGNIGKTSLCRYMAVHGLARVLPMVNDCKDILRMVYDMPDAGMYLVDMPRAITKDRLFQLWGALEIIKGGWAYDDRYEWRDRHFNPPQVVVFTNAVPDRRLLSEDRWDLRAVVDGRLEIWGAGDPL